MRAYFVTRQIRSRTLHEAWLIEVWEIALKEGFVEIIPVANEAGGRVLPKEYHVAKIEEQTRRRDRRASGSTDPEVFRALLAAVRDDFVAHLVTLIERAKADPFDRRYMDEHILAVAVGLNEKPFVALNHFTVPVATAALPWNDQLSWILSWPSQGPPALIKCFSIASQATSASSNDLNGEPIILIAPRPR